MLLKLRYKGPKIATLADTVLWNAAAGASIGDSLAEPRALVYLPQRAQT